MDSADGCSPPRVWFLPTDSSCKMHHSIVQCKGVLLLAFKDKNITKLCNFSFACSVQIYHRQQGSSLGRRQPLQIPVLLGLQCWIITSPCSGCSELKRFKKSDMGFLILLSKQFFFAPPILSPPFTVHTTFFYMLVLTKSLKNEINCLHGCFIFVIKMGFTGANKDRT